MVIPWPWDSQVYVPSSPGVAKALGAVTNAEDVPITSALIVVSANRVRVR